LPEPDPGRGQGHRAAALLYLLLYQAPELRAQDFEFIYLTWVELRGFEPPDLLHAMQLGRPACQGISGFYPRN
jgi:hypothetical protein